MQSSLIKKIVLVCHFYDIGRKPSVKMSTLVKRVVDLIYKMFDNVFPVNIKVIFKNFFTT